MTEEQFYQKAKNSIKEKKLIYVGDGFRPAIKIVLELPLKLPLEPVTDSDAFITEPVTDSDAFIDKQKIYELIGMAIMEAQVEIDA